ncbi:MAG TPA: RNA polymerase sigma factor [Acidimicrobiales bacterium]|nr:RNA polymerase sigma factor [Acidimicrobiales bacterium]
MGDAVGVVGRAGPAGPAGPGFRAFYDVAHPQVYAYLLHRVGGHADLADDLTQETFVSALREIRDGRCESVSVPWLIGVARHKLADHYRRCAREERRLERAWSRRPATAPQEGDDPGPVARCLADLPAAQRAALVLHYADDLPLKDVAALLHRSTAATNALVSRGRESFRRRYEGDGHD